MQELTQTPAEFAKEIIEGKGYVVLPNAITREEALEARELTLQCAEQERVQGKTWEDGNKERVYGLIYKGAVFEKIVQHPHVLAIVEAVLGTEDIILGGFSSHTLYKGASHLGQHVDYPYWAMPQPYPAFPVLEVQVIWLANDFTKENGASMFVDHSQKICTWPEKEKFDKESKQILGEAGSVVLSHGLCWHDTGENHTSEPRVSLLANYTQPFIQPLEDNSYDLNPEVIERATPRLKKLLRHALKPKDKFAYDTTTQYFPSEVKYS